MGFSRYLIRAVSQFYFGARAAWTPPDLYCGLFATTPSGPDDGGTEASAGGYARVATAGAWRYGVMAAGFVVANDLRGLTFDASATPMTVRGFGLWDAPTGGRLLVYGALAEPVSVPADRRLHLPAGAVALGGPMWHTGPLATLIYLMPDVIGLGPPTYHRPVGWQIYPLTAYLAHEDYLLNYSSAPPGYVEIANTTANWPVTMDELTNGVAWSYAPAVADGADITALLLVAKFGSGAYAPYWQAPLTASASVRQGERLEIPAGSFYFAEL